MLSVYSVIFFFYSWIPNLKKGSILIKIYNFVSTFIGLALSIPKNNQRSVKLIFGLIPQINIYYTSSVMYFISDTSEFSFDLLMKEVKHITYLESFVFFLGQILKFYFF